MEESLRMYESGTRNRLKWMLILLLFLGLHCIREEKSTKGYSEIEKVIRNPSSKEGFNINRYINNCLEDSPDLPGLWDFIYAIRDQLLKSLPNYTEDQVESSLENYIMPLLYNKHMSDLNLAKRDEYVLVMKFIDSLFV